MRSAIKRMKSAIWRFLPGSAKNLIRSWCTNQIQQQYAALTIEETFDRIYNTNAWVGDDSVAANSGEGSTGQYVAEYCRLIETVLYEYRVRTIADLGCGNFNIGKVIAGMVESYTGIDIAQPVIDANTRIHAGARVQFMRADLTRDALPPAEVGIVRQVLQHLTNAEIASALSNVLRTYALAIITEHIYTGPGAKPNLDIAHGPGTRVPFKSGVLIDQSPFSLRATVVGDIHYAPNEVLRTWAVQGTHLGLGTPHVTGPHSCCRAIT